MEHGDLAQAAALVGALGAGLVLLARRPAHLVAGLAVLALAEAGLAAALVPRRDLERLVASPARVVLLAAAVLALAALAAAFLRLPGIVPLALLVAAPFRLPVDLGSQEAFLLLPLYAVLAAAVLALVARALLARAGPALPLWLAAPLAAYVGLAGLSLLWSRDLRAGSIALAFFLFPFPALVAVVARSPFPRRLPGALAVALVGLGCVFAAVGLYQAATHRLFFARDLEVANAFTSYFRVTSLFKDPSLYGRHLVLAIAIVLLAVWLGRANAVLATAVGALLFAGLYFSYSQSSLAVLFVTALVIALAAAGRRSRRVLAIGAAAVAVGAIAVAVVAASGESARTATSGRTRLVAVTARVFAHHPLAGVGIGSQPLASREEAATRIAARRNASHTTPLTVAAELGIVGIAAYLAFLAGAFALLRGVVARHRTLGLALAATFFALFLHSLFYSGFFEDPLMWGVLGVGAAALARAGPRPAQPGPEVLEEPEDDAPLAGASEAERAGSEDLRLV
jgi:hypothetical protein